MERLDRQSDIAAELRTNREAQATLQRRDAELRQQLVALNDEQIRLLEAIMPKGSYESDMQLVAPKGRLDAKRQHRTQYGWQDK